MSRRSCTKCQNLEQAAHDAIEQLGLEAEFEKVTDPGEIACWGVMATPALVINDEVVLSGRVPNVKDSKNLLTAR